jgi:hypothetical protein
MAAPGPMELLIVGGLCLFPLVLAGVVVLTLFAVRKPSARASNPNLQPCPDCGRLLSPLAEMCPNCGRPLKSEKR